MLITINHRSAHFQIHSGSVYWLQTGPPCMHIPSLPALMMFSNFCWRTVSCTVSHIFLYIYFPLLDQDSVTYIYTLKKDIKNSSTTSQAMKHGSVSCSETNNLYKTYSLFLRARMYGICLSTWPTTKVCAWVCVRVAASVECVRVHRICSLPIHCIK